MTTIYTMDAYAEHTHDCASRYFVINPEGGFFSQECTCGLNDAVGAYHSLLEQNEERRRLIYNLREEISQLSIDLVEVNKDRIRSKKGD